MDMNSSMVLFSKLELKALLAHAGHGKPPQNAVYVDFRLGEVVATDGHRLALWERTDGYPVSKTTGHFLIPRSNLETTLKSAGGRHSVLFVRDGDTLGRLVVCDLRKTGSTRLDNSPDWATPAGTIATVPTTALDLAFPPYHDVIPAEVEPGEKREIEPRFSIDPTYLADLALVQTAIDTGRGRTPCKRKMPHERSRAVMTFTSPEKAVRFDFDSYDAGQWTVCIMPRRLGW